MTIDDMYNKLDRYKKDCLNGSYPRTFVDRLETIVGRLETDFIPTHGNDNVRNDIKKIVNKFSLGDEHLRKIENYLNTVDEKIKKAIEESETTKERAEPQKKERRDKEASQKSRKFVDFIPIITAVIVLVIGLSLGLTVFVDKQDSLYFALESIKDIVGCLVAGFISRECINHKRGERNSTAIVIFGSIFGLFALVFSIVLWVGSDLSIIERFTQWSKLTYLWVGLTLALIAITCAVSVVWFLLTYQPKKK